ncbi:MAG: hypothetical protein Q8Q48_02955 [Candidatus Staskawiczbacteria bacterium]|nr:hypothetical protein [Candidatus Staskawiczbacteria bacterium]
MNKANILILILIGAVLFVIGGGLGIFYQTQKDAPYLKKASTIDVLGSKVIPSVVAYGRVTKIEGRNISLTYMGDSLTVQVKDGAQVSSFVSSSGSKTPVQTKASFNDIKIGNDINISVKVLTDGQLQGESVFILSLGGAIQ